MGRSNASTIRLIVFLATIGVISIIANLYGEWLWFDSVNFKNVFTTILLNKVGLYVVIFSISLLLFYINLKVTRRHLGSPERPDETDEGREIIYLETEKSPLKELMQSKAGKWLLIGVSIVGALLVSSIAADNWIIVQQFINRMPVGSSDPIFNKDIGYYFFNLTFYKFIYNTLMMILVLITIVVATIYLLNASSNLLFGDWRQFTFGKVHIAVLLAVIFGLKAWGYKLATYGVLFSPEGLVYGATYTDIFAKLIAYKALIVVSLIVAVAILANVFVRRLKWIVFSIGAWVVIAVVLGGIYPSLMQKFIVQPNEFNKERPYIENAIKYTRQAYALDQVKFQKFDVDYNLDIYDDSNKPTVDNIRLWDWQPIRTTYKNLQQLRSYYVFNDVDIDRYTIDGKYRQVMLSPREIDAEELPAQSQTWINQKLMYTHGYGVVVSPVNEVAEEGFPQFFIKDIPPRFTTDLKVERPEIYFGQRANSYVIVNTEQKEFDYPMGAENVYTTYEGKDGIKVNSLGRRLLLGWVLKDYKLVLSTEVKNDSQILMNRNIVDRVRKVAPYLGFDSDPYIVINKGGRLYWMLDAYTVTNKYPYSEPFDRMGNNYLRNSVKITCDAYSGEMHFYVADNTDPIIQTYEKIFPGLYKPLSAMPEGLREHVRYPTDMFAVQANMYQTFHMSDPYVFYNKEDPWIIPNEIVDDKSEKVAPYYIIMRLPGEEKAEYIQMLPFTPKSRQNMNGWMCARMDGDNYGKLFVYNFSKQETIYGPEQIESRINQNTDIAQQLSLWDQRGSRVYRGNLLVIPMNNSILYVEPLYLQAENSKLPELKRVIAAFENRIVMEPTLDRALVKLFGDGPEADIKPGPEEIEQPDSTTEPSNTIEELAQLAREHYDRAQSLLQQGDWAGYGENINKLNDVIKRLEETLAE
ncbi:MAG: UPF0182 family protein [Syntrophomonadaceae bacterium]|nr:UPF0182 family protein [Syntrophomonadaceae bacterium]MDD4549824.1 UPF0182 family protein [Syntrophomonadaceae bacterium]